MAGIITTNLSYKSAAWVKFQKKFIPLPPPADGEITAVVYSGDDNLVCNYQPQFYSEARHDAPGWPRQNHPQSYTYRLLPSLYAAQSDLWHAMTIVAVWHEPSDKTDGPSLNPLQKREITQIDDRYRNLAELVEKNIGMASEALTMLQNVLNVKALFHLTLEYLSENCLLRTIIKEHAKSNKNPWI